MGLPGKPNRIDGSEVESYFLQGRIKEIADYCEADVVNTYRVWLRYELFRRNVAKMEFDASETDLTALIGARADSKPHLQHFIGGRCGTQ
jgi:3'-5' exonuclease